MARLATLVVGLALLGCGCGSSDGSESEPAPEERADRPAELPGPWKRHTNERGGFTLGLPPGWTASDRAAATLIRSYDRLVAVSITPDRTEAGMAIAIEEYAARAADALEGFRGGLDPKGSFDFGHRYDATEVRAEGASENGIDQRVSVIVLRRDELATFTAVIAANAKRAAQPSGRLAERVVGTLRSRPAKQDAQR
jgi:hypothetical protein